MSKHSGVFICGSCKKETPLADETLVKIIEDAYGLTIHNKICDCGRISYDSIIRFKAVLDTKSWGRRMITCQGK